jgi:hypothetical protein
MDGRVIILAAHAHTTIHINIGYVCVLAMIIMESIASLYIPNAGCTRLDQVGLAIHVHTRRGLTVPAAIWKSSRAAVVSCECILRVHNRFLHMSRRLLGRRLYK